MTAPAQRPGRSEQSVGTPPEFIAAVVERFGPIAIDLAATVDNAVVPRCITPEDDTLVAAWPEAGNLWLNPPFGNIAPFAKKCAEHDRRLGFVFMLVPAGVGTRWYRDHVHGKAFVLALAPRLTFVGHTSAFPKDLMLVVYGYGLHGFDLWRWKS